jgi:hypothetical protein
MQEDEQQTRQLEVIDKLILTLGQLPVVPRMIGGMWLHAYIL